MKNLLSEDIAPPFGKYAHGIAMPADARIAMTSGQLPLAKDGTTPSDPYAQALLCFQNCEAIIKAAGMGPDDVIRIAAFVTDRAHMKAYMDARDDWLGPQEVLPVSTLVIVSGFTRPEFLVEVEITAARSVD